MCYYLEPLVLMTAKALLNNMRTDRICKKLTKENPDVCLLVTVTATSVAERRAMSAKVGCASYFGVIFYLSNTTCSEFYQSCSTPCLHRDSEDDILDMLAAYDEAYFDKMTEWQLREALRLFNAGVILV